MLTFLFVCLCRTLVLMHQGQGRRNEHEHIWHPYVYHHAKFECHSLNIVRDIASSKVIKFETHCHSAEFAHHDLESRSSDWQW